MASEMSTETSGADTEMPFEITSEATTTEMPSEIKSEPTTTEKSSEIRSESINTEMPYLIWPECSGMPYGIWSGSITTEMPSEIKSEPTTTGMLSEIRPEPTTTGMPSEIKSEPTTTEMPSEIRPEPTTTEMLSEILAASTNEPTSGATTGTSVPGTGGAAAPEMEYDAEEAETVYQEFMEETPDAEPSANPEIELFGVVLRAFVQMLRQFHGQGANPRAPFRTSRRMSKSSVLSVLINSEVHGKPYRRELFNTKRFRRIICTAHVMNELSKISTTPKNEDLVSLLSSVYKDFSSNNDTENPETENAGASAATAASTAPAAE